MVSTARFIYSERISYIRIFCFAVVKIRKLHSYYHGLYHLLGTEGQTTEGDRTLMFSQLEAEVNYSLKLVEERKKKKMEAAWRKGSN